MECFYKMRMGTAIAIDGEIVTSKGFLQNETFKMKDILRVRYCAPTIKNSGFFEILTRKTYLRQKAANIKKFTPYVFSFSTQDTPIFERFFQNFLNEIRKYKGSQGTLVDGWWTWPEEDAHAPEPAAQPAAQPEAEPPAPVAPPVATQPAQPAAAVGPDLEQAIRDKVAGEKRQNGPACPDCGCTSIFADKDETGAVVITCLNCGRKWHPGEHRSW